MKFLNTHFFKKHWPKILSIFFFVLLASAYVSTFAVFAPGETLNPNCAPGTGGCIVSIGGGSSPWLTNGTNNYYNAGKVGIGTSTPVTLLDIKTSAIPTFSYLQNDSGVTGLNDATYSGSYTGAVSSTIAVSIDSVGATDTFSYSDNIGDCAQVNNVPITGLPQLICDGISITFSSITGHSMSDEWDYQISFSPTTFHIGDGTNNFFTINSVASESNFIGTGAGEGATGAGGSNFLGSHAGNNATNASSSNFLGNYVGYRAVDASQSNFLGDYAGNNATNASFSNFFGQNAGSFAIHASFSNFLGSSAGDSATYASQSNFLGDYAGNGAGNAKNSVFIGQQAGKNDTVNNTINGLSSILIGSFTNTGGFSNSILLGSGLYGFPIANTKINQFMLAPSITEMRLRGVDYTLPASQGGASTVLTNDGSGGLTWASLGSGSNAPNITGGVGGQVLYQSGSNVTAKLPNGTVGQVLTSQGGTAAPQWTTITSGSGLASDADFNTKGGTNAGLNFTGVGAQYNTFLGQDAGNGGVVTNAADYNVAIGFQSLWANTSGSNNIAIGARSLYQSTTAIENTATGFYSLSNNTTGSYNSAFGGNSLSNNTTGSYNSGYGDLSLNSNTTGSNNTGVGYEAGRFITNGSTPNQTSSNSLYLGYTTKAQADGDTNEIVIGYNATGNGTNTATIGDSSLIRTYLTGINLKASTGSAGTAPLKFASGTSLGTTEAGAIEFNGTHLYFTATNGGTRYQLDNQSIVGGNAVNITGGAGGQILYQSALDTTAKLANGTAGQVLTSQGGTAAPQWTTISGGSLLSDAGLNTKGGTNAGLNIISGAQYNSFFGYEAGKGGVVNTSMDYNTGIGFYSLTSITTGSLNSALGSNSLFSNTTGSLNTAIGDSTLYYNTSGTDNTAVGTQSMNKNTTGLANTAIGRDSLVSNTTGNYNFSGGAGSSQFNTTGSYNVVLGYQAFSYNKNGSKITAIGYNAMYNANDTATPFDGNDVALGYEALKGSASPGANTGTANSALGYQTLFSNSSGYNNTAAGWQSLYFNTTGGSNAALGSNSLGRNTSGSYNTALGVEALYESTTTSNNTAVGWDAGRYYSSSPVANQTPSNSVYLGYDTRAQAAGDTNEIVIGASAVGNGSNTTTIGTGNVLYVGGSSIGTNSKVARFTNASGYCDISPVTGGISCSSDITLKKNITNLDGKEFVLQTVPISLAPQTVLEKIMEVTPVNYNWNTEKDTDSKHIGFIAQEMEQIFPSIVSTDSKTGLKSIAYANITPYLVKGIQEMNLKIVDLQDIKTNDPNKITLGSLIRSFLSDIGNGIEKIFVKEIDTKNLCVSDENGVKTCLSKIQLDELLAKAGGVSGGTNNLNTQQNNPPVLTIDEQLTKARTDIEARVEGNYTEASWSLFITAKTSAMALPDTNDEEKTLKIKALNDAIKVLVAKVENTTVTAGTAQIDLSAYNEVLGRIVGASYTPESFEIYQNIVNTNSMTEKNSQAEINTAVNNILAAQSNLVKTTTE
ncbi:tail fiber domain-containing protein [Candidatus Nomurabacteria bacterium]|nr:tail fiber domain-containing protein [Candidatus Nomurabacteria bacterium]